MTAAVADHHVSVMFDLTGAKIDSAQRFVNRASAGDRIVVRMMASLLSFVAIRLCDRVTKNTTDQAIWFKGATQEIWDGSVDLDLEKINPLADRLDHLLESLNGLRTQLNDVSETKTTLASAKRRAMASCIDLHDSVSAFRWALLEYEASQAVRVPGYFAETPDALEALFDKITSE